MKSSSTGLASWLKESYDSWFKERQKVLGPKWRRNLRLFSGQDIIEKTFKTKGEEEDDVSWKSKTFIKLIKVKVMMAYSLLVDVLLGNGQVPFKLTVDDFIKQLDQIDDEQIDSAIQQMEGQIRQWHKDRHMDRELMKTIFSMCLYGETWMKFNSQDVDYTTYQQTPEGIRPQIQQKAVPGSSYLSVWSMVWDTEKDNIQDNQGVIEQSMYSPFDLWLMKQGPYKSYYYPQAIDSIISSSKESSGQQSSAQYSDNLPRAYRDILNRTANITDLEFWGRVPAILAKDFVEQMEQIEQIEELTELHDYIEAYDGSEIEVVAELCMCGDQEHIIRFGVNEMGKRPYKRCFLEQTLDNEAPSGVADNLEDIQISLNGMMRSFEDNKKLSANVILAVIARYLPPGALKKLYEGKLLELQKSDIDDIRKVIQPIEIPDVGETLLSGIGLIRNLADLVSQLPSILQGEMLTKQKPDTAYEMSQLLEGAGKYLGQAVKNIDEMIIEEDIQELSQEILMDPEYPGTKLPVKVNATGFQSYQDKVLQYQRVIKNLQLVLSSDALAMEAKIRKHLEEIYKASDLDPDDFLNSDEEKQQIQEQQEAARAKALEEQIQLIIQEANAKATAEAEAKAEIETVKAQETRATEMVKGDEERETSEQEFQQDIVLQGLDGDQDLVLEKEKAKNQPKETPKKPTK